LRIAFVSALKRTINSELRAEKELAGRSVLEWQIDLALELKCERIICLCESTFGTVITQQRRVEGEGFAFHTVRNHLQLTSLVRADDEIFVQLDGLVLGGAARASILRLNEKASKRVYTIAASHPLSVSYPNDFERIDRERHWAGIGLVPGDCALALKDMHADGDAMSLLLRLALQLQVHCESVRTAMLDNDQWLLADDSEALERRANALIMSNIPQASWSGPAAALAATVVRASAPFWLRSGGEIGAGLAVAGMTAAGVLAGFGYAVAALSLGAFAAFFANLSANSAILRTAVSAFAKVPVFSRLLSFATAGLATAVLTLAHLEASNWPIQVGIPLLAIGLTRVAGADSLTHFGAFWRDLPTHLALYAVSAFFGVLQEALLLFSLGALLQLMLRTRHQ